MIRMDLKQQNSSEARQTPLAQKNLVRRVLEQVSLGNILLLFLLTRLMLVAVTYFGIILLTQDKYAGNAVPLATFIDAWNRWDAQRYVHIAQGGYFWDAAIHTHTAHSSYSPLSNFAFFPLFPLLISLGIQLFGPGSAPVLGMLISNLALLGTLVLLYVLAKEIAGEKVAHRTLLYLCIFPTEFFFFSAYNESLFLLFTVAAFLALRKQRWWLAGLCGFLAALTRSAGIWFILPFVYELWRQREAIRESVGRVLYSTLPLLLIPLGLLVFAFYCWQQSGDPLAFASVQILWGRQLAWPWQGIVQNLFEIFWNQPFGSFFQVHDLLDLSATLGLLTLILLGWRRLPRGYSLWMGVLLLYILLTPSTGQHDALPSNQRFVLEFFPAFITLAGLGIRHPRLHTTLVWVFPALLATLTLLFVMGKWMV